MMTRGSGTAWQLCRLIVATAMVAVSGCAAIPDVKHKPTFHNPFPQLHRIAVLPFFNQSREPTVDGDAVALAYAAELQQVPGFEVMPVGVVKRAVEATQFEPRGGADFQRLARMIGVDAVIVGSVTEFHPYYPPRLAMTVDWYAANPGFHPIPAGYGLPWGTADEEYIPESLREEAEFALAREQLATQSPELPSDPVETPATVAPSNAVEPASAETRQAAAAETLPPVEVTRVSPSHVVVGPLGGLPADWPDPRGFVPAQPSATKPTLRPQHKPVITHTRMYNGKDSDFTEKLANYFYQQDDARFGGWQGYLQRPDDFTRFCCHLHVTEALAARGGAGKTRVTVRWPIGRYER